MQENNFSNGNIAYSAQSAYPEIIVSEINLTYAHILSQNLFAQKGEMTAVNQYIYQSWHIFEENCGISLSDFFQNLAKVEMRHMNFLGQMICCLGLNPCCYAMIGAHPKPWNGTYLSYGINLKELVQHNLASEKLTIQNYRKAITQIDDRKINAVLERICLDEEIHVELFEQLLTRI